LLEVTQLFIYPVKGLRGIRLTQARLTPLGLAYDRHWMIVMPSGRMVTQRQKPLMAAIRTHLSMRKLTLSMAGQQPLQIPLDNPDLARVPVSLWRDRFSALDEGSAAAAWLTAALDSDYPLRLVRVAEDVKRPQSKPQLLGFDTTTRFADAAPFLVTNEDSLSALNHQFSRLNMNGLAMERFRSNIWVKGLPPYTEYCRGALTEASQRYRIKLCYPSERCVVMNTDQQTGEVDKQGRQPLDVLKELQTAPGRDGAFFGQKAILHDGSQRVIRVGDQLHFDSSSSA